MTETLLGMAVCLALAVLVLSLVAIPRVRAGSKLLTTEGEESLRDAQRRARALAAQARLRAGEPAAAGHARDRAGWAGLARRVGRAGRGEAVPVDTPVVAGVGVGTPGGPGVTTAGAASSRTAGAGAAPVSAATSPGGQAAGRPPADPVQVLTGEPAPTADAVDVAALDRDLEARVVDLRDGVSAHERAVEHRVEQRLTWGEPRPGPRHGRR